MVTITRLTIEEVPSFSVQSIKEAMDNQTLTLTLEGYIVPFIIRTSGNSFTIQPDGASEPQTVSIEHTSVGYGKRAWFVCPFCKKRCSRLYMISGVFGCRGCHDLTYTSCQISGNEFVILTREVRKLQRRLGMEIITDVSSPDYVSIQDTPIYKPKRMKEQTWLRLRTKLEIVQLHRMQAWLDIAR